MPLLITLKDPRVTHICKGNLKDVRISKEWLKELGGGIVAELDPDEEDKGGDGQIMIPSNKDSNIAFIREVTDEKLVELRAEWKKQEEEREAQLKAQQEAAAAGRGGGRRLVDPAMMITHPSRPGGKKRH